MRLPSCAWLLCVLSVCACAVGTVVDQDVPDAQVRTDTRPMGLDAQDVAMAMDAGPACGTSGAACCAGNVCATGTVCAENVCVVPAACGNDGQPCCGGDGGGGNCSAGLVCSTGRCAPTAMVMCGGAMQACCAGGACQAGFVCAAAQCVMCGAVGSPCCAGACLSGGVCAAGQCAADMDGDGSPAGADCNDRNPNVRPGARERCNAVDDDCNGTVDDAPACGLWSLPRGESAWRAYAIDPVHDADATMRSPHAPGAGVIIRAMLSVDTAGVVYAITDATYHVLDLATRMWTAHGSRDVLFPQIAGRALTGAFATPGRPVTATSTDTFSFVTPANVFNYSIVPATQAVSFLSMGGPVSWPGDPNAPQTTGWRFNWLDLDNAEGWVTTDIHSVCSMAPADAIFQRYLALIDSTGGASGTLHVSDLGYCFRWAPAQSIEAFPPFALATAPRPVDIGAAFYRSGLWAIRPRNN